MIYPIVKYGNAVLETPAHTVTDFNDELHKLADDMFESMYAAQGVGLAAPQLGLSLRLAVIDVTNGKNAEAKIVCANPKIIHSEGEQREEEGCLSVPGFRGHVLRPRYVTVRAQDAADNEFEMRGEGLLAKQTAKLFAVACRKAGIPGKIPELSTAAFRRPAGAQLELL